MIKFVKLVNDSIVARAEKKSSFNYNLEEIWINRNNIVKVERNTSAIRLLEGGHLPPNLNKNHEFSTITVDNCGRMETIVVVGEANNIAARVLDDTERVLLKG